MYVQRTGCFEEKHTAILEDVLAEIRSFCHELTMRKQGHREKMDLILISI